MSEQEMCDPTEETLYREPHDDRIGTWEDRLFKCGPIPYQGIGIDVGGTVHVRPLKHWHSLESENARLRKALENIASHEAQGGEAGYFGELAREALEGGK